MSTIAYLRNLVLRRKIKVRAHNGGNPLVRRFVLQIMSAVFVLSANSVSQQPANQCPLVFSGAHYLGTTVTMSPTFPPGEPVRKGVLSLKYTNVTKDEIAAFVVKASSQMQVNGPKVPRMVNTAVEVPVWDSVAPGKSKRKKTHVALASTTTRVSLWLKEVTYLNGTIWKNDSPSQCVFVPGRSRIFGGAGPV